MVAAVTPAHLPLAPACARAPNPWSELLAAVASGLIVTVAHSGAADLHAKRLAVLTRARERGLMVQTRQNERVLAVRLLPQTPRTEAAPPDTLMRVAAELAAERALEQQRRPPLGPIERQSGVRTAGLPVVTATRVGVGRCHTCAQQAPLRFLVLRNCYRGARGGEGAEGWLLCATCLAQTPHKLLF